MNLIDSFLKSVSGRDDAVIDQNGRAVCPICGDPVTMTIHIKDEIREVPVACTCRKRGWKQQEEKQKAEETARMIDRCFFGSSEMRSCTFDMDDGLEERPSRICRKYADRFDEMLEKHQGLLLMGAPGTGKSFYAACIANKLLHESYSVRFINVASIPNMLFTVQDKLELIRSECDCSLLILDDLGAERTSSYAAESIYQLVNERYVQNLPMIVTTNLTGSEMKNQDISRQRMYDRIVQRCYPVAFHGANRRMKEAADRKAYMDKLFEGDL